MSEIDFVILDGVVHVLGAPPDLVDGADNDGRYEVTFCDLLLEGVEVIPDREPPFPPCPRCWESYVDCCGAGWHDEA